MGPMDYNNSNQNLDARFVPPVRGLNQNTLNSDRMAGVREDLSSTLQSFRDSLAFSFQTLNLTLSSLNNSVRLVGTKLNINDPSLLNSQYLPASKLNTYYGGLSRGYAQFAGNQSLTGMLFANPPYNVSPMEYWLERNREMPMRLSSAAAGITGAAINTGAYMAGSAAGGAWLGGSLGVSSSLGRMMLGVPFGMAAGSLVGAVVDPMVAAAQEHNRDVSAIRRMSPRFRSQFSLREAQTVATGMEDLAFSEIINTNSLMPRLNMSGMRDIAMMGMQGNMFQGTSPEQMLQQLKQAGQVVKFLTGVMGNKDIQETMQAVKQMKDMGVNLFQTTGAAQNIGTDAFRYSKAMGVDAATLLNQSMNMSAAAFGQYGNPAFIGIQPTMQNLAYLSELEKRRGLSTADIASGGGISTIAGKISAAQATLLNSNNIGMPLLASGWQGSGFNQQMFSNTMRNNGYFGAIAQGAHNMFSQGLRGISNYYMNRNNIAADMANQGTLSDNMRDILESVVSQMPGLNDPTLSPSDRTNMVAMYIQNVMESNGNPIDAATAKAYAMQMVQPSYMRTAERNANQQYILGVGENMRAQMGPGRFIERIGEGVERFTSKIHKNLILNPGRALGDWFSNSFDGTLEGNGARTNVPLTGESLRNYRWALDVARGADSRATGSRYQASDLYNSWNRLGIRDTLGSSVLSLYSSITGNADQNRLTAMLDTNMGFQYADMWNRIASGNTMSKEQAMGDMYAWLKGSTTRKDIEKVFSEYEENGTAADPLRAAADLFINKGNGVMATQADAMYAALREKNVFSTDSLRQVFGDQFVKDNVAGGRIAGTADFIASGYGSDPNVRKRAEKYVQQLRSEGINITVDQYLGGVGLTYAKDTNRNQSNLSKVMVAGKLDRVKEFAMPFASQFGAERYANLVPGTEGFNLMSSSANRLLENLGITETGLADLMSSGSSPEEIEAFGQILQMYTAGNYSPGEGPSSEQLASYARKIKNKELSSAVSRLGDEGSLWARRQVRDFSDKTPGGTSDYEKLYKEDTARLFRDVIGFKMVDDTRGKLDTTLSDIGFKLKNGQSAAEAAITPGGLGKLIMNSTALTDEAARAQEFISSVYKMSDNEIQERFGASLNIDKVNASNRESIRDSIVTRAIQLQKEETQQSTEKMARVTKSAIDTTVDKDGAGKPAVRVIMSTAPEEKAEKARDKFNNITGETSFKPNWWTWDNRQNIQKRGGLNGMPPTTFDLGYGS